MLPMRLRFTAFRLVDWGRLAEHLTGALLLACGMAIVSEPSEPIWIVLVPALKLWIGASLAYAGGFIQNAEKLKEKNAFDAPDPESIEGDKDK